ncbi:amidohydrolase [Altericroceibacterium spongiae]|uniref:Amidohydrolase n=1 Tax=Altericroceibacterium spongiae TaxID=2320269 RepID=A0A420EP68_9SPHN|nr:M20 family metallopeptidase [Altericroceibacterium spongiae]RKF22470.1 amidohydrolase [Altericroceibacterium spongiae]
MLHETLLADARALSDTIISLRRAIHAEPELGLDTPATLSKAREALADLPLEWREATSCTGAIATLKGTKTTRSGAPLRVLLRGDMDALPMEEATGLPFASRLPGRMHACGHDTHTAMLAGAARLLCAKRADFAGEVQFMFQPGEEGFHGARHMIADGLLDPAPDAAFALHIMPNSRHGVLASRPGALMAAADQLEITVKGNGGHASMPHHAVDPVPVAAEIITALQALVTRRFNAADAVVVTITQLEAGSAHNVIADDAMLKGTMRTLSSENRTALHQAVARLAENIAAAHGLHAEVKIIEGFPVTLNDPRAVTLGAAVAQAAAGGAFERLASPIMGAEDFSYVLEQVPGAMFFLGVAEEGADWQHCCGIHSSRMMVDETALPVGTAFLAGCALRFLAEGWPA